MKPSDIAALTAAGDPQLSPDGRHIAYVLSRVDHEANSYTSQIWIAATNGSTQPRPLTAGEHKDSQPRWSPDGTQLAFVSARKTDAKGKTRSTLHLLPFGVPGETVLLAEGDEAFEGPTFSPDASMLAVSQRVRSDHYEHDEVSRRPARKIESYFSKLNGQGFIFDRPKHVHVVAVDGSAPMRDITPGPWECSSPSWFDDGQRLAVEINRFPTNFSSDIGIVSLDRADPELLTDGTGMYGLPIVTPVGSVLVAGLDDSETVPQNEHLGVLTPGRVATPDWKSHGVDRTWRPVSAGSSPCFVSNDEVLAALEDRGDTHLYRLNIETGAAEPVIDGELSITGWSHGSIGNSEAIAYTATTATEPSELHLLIDGESRQLTNHSKSFVANVAPRQPEHFLAPSGDVEVDAWIVTPPNFDSAKKYPMLLNIHGGPFTQYGNFFFDEVQMQAEAGYVVVYSNPRGGSGRTNKWAHAILGPKHKVSGSGWGGVDYDDCMAVVDTALERYDFIDAGKLGVLGGSYGGYMTSWIVTHTDRFAAACSERAVNNLLSLEHSSDIAGFFHAEIGPKFVDDPDEYLRMSPITYVKELNTPLLILHSEDDLRCPQDQAWQLFNACKMLDKPDVEFWLFPDENHELSRAGSPAHRKQRAEIILDFFGRYLQAAS